MLGESRVLNLGSTEWDSDEAVRENRVAFLRAVGGGRAALVTLRQCHTDVIHLVGAASGHALRGDALITRAHGLLLAVQTADCVPILLADRRTRAVAAVHAGWRGTLARITEKALGRMKMEFDTRAQDVVAALGPAIGGCCYEVGPEVAQAFAAQFADARDWFEGPFERLAGGDDPAPFPWLSMTPPGHDAPAPRVRLDLRAANRRQLEAAGVPAAHIVSSALCTSCRTDLLFSHRRERGRTGRLMSVVGIRA
jgi:YfiH family protein